MATSTFTQLLSSVVEPVEKGRTRKATARGLETEGSVIVEQRVNADSKNRFMTSLCHYINTIILGKLRVLVPQRLCVGEEKMSS